MTWIQTFTGKRFDLLDPQPDQVCIEDIAHALAHMCRYTGHTNRFYSVAHHSILCCHQAPEGYKLEALMHDATEAYIGDLSSPLKMCPGMGAFARMEKRVWTAIAIKYALGSQMPPMIKEIDRRMLMTEKLQFFRDDLWWGVEAEPYSDLVIGRLSPEAGKLLFLERFVELTRQR